MKLSICLDSPYDTSGTPHKVLLVLEVRRGNLRLIHVNFLNHPGVTVRALAQLWTLRSGKGCDCSSMADDLRGLRSPMLEWTTDKLANRWMSNARALHEIRRQNRVARALMVPKRYLH